MSRIIAFLGSPRKKGFTAELMTQAIEGAKSAGAKVSIYDLNDDGIKGCQGCFHCRTQEGCATRDKLYPVYEELKEADGIIAGYQNPDDRRRVPLHDYRDL